MSINPKNIINLLNEHFKKYEQNSILNDEEKNIARDFISTIETCLAQGSSIEIFDDLVVDDYAEFDCKEDYEADDFSHTIDAEEEEEEIPENSAVDRLFFVNIYRILKVFYSFVWL